MPEVEALSACPTVAVPVIDGAPAAALFAVPTLRRSARVVTPDQSRPDIVQE